MDSGFCYYLLADLFTSELINGLMLKLGGYINILIALTHILGLFWADKIFEVTGIGKEMTELAQTHSDYHIYSQFLCQLCFLFLAYMEFRQTTNLDDYHY